MADMPMLSETAEPAAESLPDRGKHGSFPAATAWTAVNSATIHGAPSFVVSLFTRSMQPPFGAFVNLWTPGRREARTWATGSCRHSRGSRSSTLGGRSKYSFPGAVHDTQILDFHQSYRNGQTRPSISEAAAFSSGSGPKPVGRESLESISVSRRDYGDSGVPSGLRYGLEGLSPHRLFGFLRISFPT